MNLVFQAADALQSFLQAQGWPFCFIGGLAVQHWGEPRVTRDADVTLLAGFGREEEFARKLAERFQPRVPDFMEKATLARVVLLADEHGVGLDVALGALPFEEQVIARSRDVKFLDNWSLKICSAEDLLVMKSLAGRTRDWLDVETVLIRQGAKLDWPYVKRELALLAELAEKPDAPDELERLRRKLLKT
jgi:hypothetical protein